MPECAWNLMAKQPRSAARSPSEMCSWIQRSPRKLAVYCLAKYLVNVHWPQWERGLINDRRSLSVCIPPTRQRQREGKAVQAHLCREGGRTDTKQGTILRGSACGSSQRKKPRAQTAQSDR